MYDVHLTVRQSFQGPQSQLSFRKVPEQSVVDHPTWYDNSTSQSCSNPFIPSSASQSDTHISFDKVCSQPQGRHYHMMCVHVDFEV